MKVFKHSFCKRENCNLIGKEVEVEETIKASIDKETGKIIEPKYCWARVGGVLHKFQGGDLK